MKHCDKCNVDIQTNQKYCPLCHQILSGEEDFTKKEIYPEYVPLNRTVLPLTKKIMLFITVVTIITLVSVNYFTYDTTPTMWSLIPIGSTLYFWLVVRYGILSKQNIAFKLAFLTTLLLIILNLIDQNYTIAPATPGWALNYVTPLALLACNFAISVIIWVKRINYREYLIYLLSILVFSLIPIILGLFKIITVLWPSIAAFGAAMFILLVIIFFFPKSIKNEIRKRFHL